MSAHDDNIATIVAMLTDPTYGSANTIKLLRAVIVNQFNTPGAVTDDKILLACTVLGINPEVDPPS